MGRTQQWGRGRAPAISKMLCIGEKSGTSTGGAGATLLLRLQADILCLTDSSAQALLQNNSTLPVASVHAIMSEDEVACLLSDMPCEKSGQDRGCTVTEQQCFECLTSTVET